MKALSLEILTVLTLLILVMTQNNPNITFAPPPPINISQVANFSALNPDTRFYRSVKLQTIVLTILPTGVNAFTTNFQLRRFQRGSPNNIQIFQFNRTGMWGIVQTTKQSFSCGIALESTNSFIGFIRFKNNIFEMFYQTATLDIAGFDTTNMGLKENCLVYNEPTLYNMTVNGLSPITVPSNDWDISDAPELITYVATGFGLYRYSTVTFSYTKIYNFTTNITNTNYDLKSYQTNIIVVVASGNSSQITQEFYIFSDAASSITLLDRFSVTARNPANLTILPYLTSPKLTKFGIIYNSTTSTNQSLIAKTIDYAKLTVKNLTFQDPSRFFTTIRNIPPTNKDYYFGDNYYVLRNASVYNASVPTAIPVEQAYQFVGEKIIFLRSRVLTGKDLTSYSAGFVDLYNQNQLVVLNKYNDPIAGFTVDQVVYGNLVSINRIVPLTTPPFISFTVPTNTDSFIPNNALTWLYLNTVANSTRVTIIRGNPNVTNNLEIINSNIGGTQSILAVSEKCLIIKQASENILVASLPTNYSPSPNSTITFVTQDITQVLSTSNANVTQRWIVSNDCSRFSVDSKAFYRTSDQVLPYALPSASISFDDSITTALVGNSVWLLNNQTNSFSLAFNNTNTLFQWSNIYKVDNKILITGKNVTSAQVIAYSINNQGHFTNSLNYIFINFQNTPKIQVSSKLTKVLVIGPFIPPNKTSIQSKYDAFFIDYANSTSNKISFPFSVPDPLNSFIVVDQHYVYIRSLTSNFTNYPNGTQAQENIFYINQNISPQLSFSVNLTQDQVSKFKRAIFTVNANGSLNNYVESLNNSQVIVNKVQTSAQQAKIKQNSNILGVTAMISDGVIVLCSPGCSDCSTGTCSSCVSSWVFDSSSYSCFRCGQNCATCSSQNAQLCYTCLTGSYLSSNSTCLSCDRSCTSCNQTATNCLSCSPSRIFINGSCTSCPRNCISCSNSNTCLTCAKGFVVVGNGTCRGCALSCSNCSSTNITYCTSCAPGLSLVNSTCVSCPDKCQICSNQICASCILGYTPNTAGVCVLNCAISCATCADNQPTTCLSCYGSNSYVLNGKCVLNTTCNSDSSCTNCGQGLGYVLVGSLCVQCSPIDNCLQCSSTNTANCSLCMNGFYIDSNYLCSNCSVGCLQCSSADICTACSIGYTLPQNSTQGQCLQCQSPCATCLGVTTYCLTCLDGYTKRGWKCQQKKYASFVFTLADTPSNVLGNVDYIVGRLLLALGLNSTFVDAITFNSIYAGSTVVVGSASTQTPSAASAALSASLSSGSLGTYTVTSSSVTTVGTEEEKQTANVGLIVGLVVGLLAFVVIVVIIVYVVYKRKTNKKIESQLQIQLEEDRKEKKPVSQSGEMNHLNLGKANSIEIIEKQ